MANRLIDEQSPYLLQHAHNPVNWYPWGDEAFEKAKHDHKPVIVSIGYAACHWCHVMEHESFEDEEVAAYMNEHFVCVKVDREEHPDVDHLYMDAVQAMNGNGGWPLNVFVTPDRAPFYGGTYYPPRPAYNRPSWMQLLNRISELWTQQYDEVAHQAEQLIQHLTQASQRKAPGGGSQPEADKTTCRQIADSLLKQADKENGGFGNAPKFPGTMAICYLLEHYHFTGYEPALQHALHSLDAMANGGIYDQLSGGFARYATDSKWLIPHFEKMLYDNALLIIAFCDAYAVTQEPRYKTIAEDTIAYIERSLKHPGGGYYCAQDADSEGEEGKYYTWTWQEWIDSLETNDEIVAGYFGVTPGGNWEQTNILHIAAHIDALSAKYNVSPGEVKQRIDAVRAKLLERRAKRVPPQTDDKILLSWNALMNIALSKAGVALNNAGYVNLATEHMEWMISAYETEGGMLHVWKEGKAKIAAKLDDYAYLAQAMLQLSSASGENKWIVKAHGLLQQVMHDFNQEQFFYFSPATQKDIPVRKVDLYDGATPSANAVMAHNLWITGMCMEKSDWVRRAGLMVTEMTGTSVRYGYSFAYWAMLLQRQVMGMKTVVCASTAAGELRQELQKNYQPEVYLVTSQKEISEIPIVEKKYFADKMSIFVCTEQACLPPVSSINEALLTLGIQKKI